MISVAALIFELSPCTDKKGTSAIGHQKCMTCLLQATILKELTHGSQVFVAMNSCGAVPFPGRCGSLMLQEMVSNIRPRPLTGGTEGARSCATAFSCGSTVQASSLLSSCSAVSVPMRSALWKTPEVES